MSLFNFFQKRTTAPAARERLQILLAHERTNGEHSDLVNLLREEIIQVIAKHICVDGEKVAVKMDKGDKFSTLEVDIELPVDAKIKKAA
ncbi:cell division topological specificity factor MinE [Fulvimarina endophytica]|uniref:Cell division topological specificity factor n=1 Tax=Fulvimarina endophytica TaxID=2293836 RepID=A0A371X261_9HYPH|nr:cell division topological specificity factor MinE [Fulvimarina endophytica]RFC63310.1 cell division topological specificity factor MinE [Fulvimarina endophytica]